MLQRLVFHLAGVVGGDAFVERDASPVGIRGAAHGEVLEQGHLVGDGVGRGLDVGHEVDDAWLGRRQQDHVERRVVECAAVGRKGVLRVLVGAGLAGNNL